MEVDGDSIEVHREVEQNGDPSDYTPATFVRTRVHVILSDITTRHTGDYRYPYLLMIIIIRRRIITIVNTHSYSATAATYRSQIGQQSGNDI